MADQRQAPGAAEALPTWGEHLTPRAREIVRAARELLEESGAEKLTMRSLADRLGIKAPSLYKHFPDKSAVEVELIAQMLDELATVCEAAAPGSRGGTAVPGSSAGASAPGSPAEAGAPGSAAEAAAQGALAEVAAPGSPGGVAAPGSQAGASAPDSPAEAEAPGSAVDGAPPGALAEAADPGSLAEPRAPHSRAEAEAPGSAADASAPSPLEALTDAYRAYALRHPHLYRLATERPLPRHALPEGLEDRAAAPLVRACAGDGELARAAWAFAHGMVILEIHGRFPEGADLGAAWKKGTRALIG